MAWECYECARVIDLKADDFCPVCGTMLPEPEEVIVAHTSRVLTATQAARAWDAATRPTTRTMIRLPADLEGE
jgi:RNA polymerase subunit RPABC4/transcription elongation factor Spt4